MKAVLHGSTIQFCGGDAMAFSSDDPVWRGLQSLEARLLLTAALNDWFDASRLDIEGLGQAPTLLPAAELVDVQKAIVAGDPNGSPPDTPEDRIDPNTSDSPFAGVGSLEIFHSSGTYICTGTLISPMHVLTAGHCVDIDNNGIIDVTGINFRLNIDVDAPIDQPDIIISVSDIDLHPDYTGFNNPSINDDVAVLTLSAPVPDGIPYYQISTAPFDGTEVITLVGYGTTGDGVSGYIDGSHSPTIKRVGGNISDFSDVDDEGSGVVEVFRFDFDDPDDPTGLGNDVETTLGGGDSGGPSFIPDGQGGWMLFGVNTHSFSFFFGPEAPLFGSGGGGMVVSAYTDFIFPLLSPVQITETGGSTDVSEDGATDTYTIVLDSQPAADVTVTITPDAQVTVDMVSLTFTPGDWNVAQTVTVGAVDDADAEGPHFGSIAHTVSSADPNFDGASARTVTVNVADDEIVAPINAIQDGGFEAGTPNPFWTEESTNFGTPIVDESAGTGGGLQGPRTGEYWAWFGGIDALEIGEVRQIVELNGPTTLDFYLHIPSTNFSTSDTFRVFVDNTEVFGVTASGYSPYFFGYELVSLDLTPLADGELHNIRFNGVTFGDNGNGLTNFFVDDITLTTGSGNAAPAAADDAAATDEDAAVTIDVLANDGDDDGDPLSVTGASNPANGSAVINADDTITYTPAADFNGTDTFTYTIGDGNGGTDTATVTVTVNPINDAPIAADDNASTTEDTPLVIAVLANDDDVDGDALTVSGVTQGANGAVANGAASVTYTPNAGFTGTDTFTYTITDGAGGTDTATVTVTVSPTNDAPVAVDDDAVTDEDTAVTVAVLNNDSDGDGDPLSVTGASNPANGSAVINADDTITYTPDADFNGTDTFTYTITDGAGGTDTAMVTVTVNAVNDAPVAVDDDATTQQDTGVVVDVLANDGDADGDGLTIIGASDPANGAAVVNADNTITYTPDAGFTGTDTFTYTISDGNGGTDTATVTMTVAADEPAVGTVTITRAAYNANKSELNVEAVSSEGGAEPLRMDYFDADGSPLGVNVALSYNSRKDKWSAKVTETTTPVTVKVYFESDMSVFADAAVEVGGGGGGGGGDNGNGNGGGPKPKNNHAADPVVGGDTFIAALASLASFDLSARAGAPLAALAVWSFDADDDGDDAAAAPTWAMDDDVQIVV